jgi:alkylhydroperoxidase family enzyme
MARIARVWGPDAGQEVEVALRYTRSGLAQLTGRETERMIEPMELYAHIPGLFRGYGMLEQATAELDRLDKRVRALAELKAATLTHCEYCIDLG